MSDRQSFVLPSLCYIITHTILLLQNFIIYLPNKLYQNTNNNRPSDKGPIKIYIFYVMKRNGFAVVLPMCVCIFIVIKGAQ